MGVNLSDLIKLGRSPNDVILRNPHFNTINQIATLFVYHCQALSRKRRQNQDEILFDLRQDIPVDVVCSRFILKKLNEMSVVFEAIEIDYNATMVKSIGDIYTAIRMLQMNPAESKDCYQWLVMVVESLEMQSGDKEYFPTTQETMLAIKYDNTIEKADKAKLLVKAMFADYHLMRSSFLESGIDCTMEQYMNDHPAQFHTTRKLGLTLKSVIVHFQEAISIKMLAEIKEENIVGLKNPYKDFLTHATPQSPVPAIYHRAK